MADEQPPACVSAAELVECLPTLPPAPEDPVPCILIDARPYSEYALSHIVTAMSVRLSSILLRRLSKNKITVGDLLVDDQKTMYTERLPCCSWQYSVVVYDENSTVESLQTPLPALLQSLTSQGISCAFLDGGFERFKELFPERMGSAEDMATPVPFGKNSFPQGIRKPESPMNRRHYAKEKDPPTEILPYLFIGADFHSKDKAVLDVLGVTAVLNVTSHNIRPADETLKYKQIPIRDTWNQNLMDHMQEAFEFIDDAAADGGKVLVHCVAGISRSPAVTIAYVMRTLSMGLADAYAFVRDKRPTISPNLDFMGELQLYERRLQASTGLKVATPAILADVDSDDGRDSKQEEEDDDEFGAHVMTPISTTASFALPVE